MSAFTKPEAARTLPIATLRQFASSDVDLRRTLGKSSTGEPELRTTVEAHLRTHISARASLAQVIKKAPAGQLLDQCRMESGEQPASAAVKICSDRVDRAFSSVHAAPGQKERSAKEGRAGRAISRLVALRKEAGEASGRAKTTSRAERALDRIYGTWERRNAEG